MNELPGDPRLQELTSHLLGDSRDYAFLFLDPEGLVLAWQGAAELILGYSQEEMLGQPLSRIFVPEDRARHFDRYELELAKADSSSEDERWHVRKDGTRIWVVGTVTAMRRENGELVGFIKIMRDQTDLRGQIEALENHVTGLRDARRRTHLFLKKLGHELRNPLAPLTTVSHLIGRLSDDPKIQNGVQIIGRQVALLTRLADDLMDVARLEEGKVQLQLEPLDLRALLDDAVASLRNSASHKGLKLAAILPEAPLLLEADRERLQQVVLNLLNNAIKYTPPGGSVWVKATVDALEAIFRVQDTGIGIAPEVLPGIFDLFTRDANAEDMAPGGLGIGLTLVRELVELHGGSVQARSAGLGKGAEFTVRLPVRQAAPRLS